MTVNCKCPNYVRLCKLMVWDFHKNTGVNFSIIPPVLLRCIVLPNAGLSRDQAYLSLDKKPSQTQLKADKRAF